MSLRLALAGAIAFALTPSAAPAQEAGTREVITASILFLDLHGNAPFQFWIDDKLVFDGRFPAESPSTGLTAIPDRDVAKGEHRFRMHAGALDVSRRLVVDGIHRTILVSKVPGREIEVTDKVMLA